VVEIPKAFDSWLAEAVEMSMSGQQVAWRAQACCRRLRGPKKVKTEPEGVDTRFREMELSSWEIVVKASVESG